MNFKICTLAIYGLFLLGCSTPPLRMSSNTKYEEDRSPASFETQDITELALRQDMQKAQTPEGQEYSAALSKELQGTWKTNCIKRPELTYWFQRTLNIDKGILSTSTKRYSDDQCTQVLSVASSVNIKILTAVKTTYGFRFNLNWTDAKFSHSDEASRNQTPYPFFLGTLDESKELYGYPYINGYNCAETYSANGKIWCNKFSKINN
ncbi:MAG: hypothetical protein IPM97_16130 [Bdellovibrionaceae bacterium]|nr:hypothetical protein [Pseudobdellovibrionaceae bacterium]